MSLLGEMIRRFPDVPAVELQRSVVAAEMTVRTLEPKFWDRLEKLFEDKEKVRKIDELRKGRGGTRA